MKVRANIQKMIEREVEVDDKFLPLCEDDFWANHWLEAMRLSDYLKEEVNKKLLDDETEVVYIEDINGNIIFE